MCRIMINDMSSRTALRSLIRGGNNGEDEAIRQVNATAIRREIQANRNDIVDIKQQIAAKETRISQIDKKIEYNEKLIASNEKLIDNTEKLIESNEKLIDNTEKLIEGTEKLIAKEENLLKDLVESRDLGRKQEKLIEGKISLLSKMADVVKALLKIKQEKAANAGDSPMKDVTQPLPQQGQAASVVTSQQTNDISAKTIDNILSATPKKGAAKPLTKSDYRSLRAGTEKIAYNSLGKDNKSKEVTRFTNEPEESYSRFSDMFKAYRAEMKSLDRMLSVLRIKI